MMQLIIVTHVVKSYGHLGFDQVLDPVAMLLLSYWPA